EVVEDWVGRMDTLRAYSTTGVRGDCDFFLWKITERYADLGELGAALNGTPLAGYLETPYSYLATMKASEYTKARKPRKIVPKESPYLVVYPFVKLRSWFGTSRTRRASAPRRRRRRRGRPSSDQARNRRRSRPGRALRHRRRRAAGAATRSRSRGGAGRARTCTARPRSR